MPGQCHHGDQGKPGLEGLEQMKGEGWGLWQSFGRHSSVSGALGLP